MISHPGEDVKPLCKKIFRRRCTSRNERPRVHTAAINRGHSSRHGYTAPRPLPLTKRRFWTMLPHRRIDQNPTPFCIIAAVARRGALLRPATRLHLIYGRTYSTTPNRLESRASRKSAFLCNLTRILHEFDCNSCKILRRFGALSLSIGAISLAALRRSAYDRKRCERSIVRAQRSHSSRGGAMIASVHRYKRIHFEVFAK